MNKIIFEVGLLAFVVSGVYYSAQGFDLFSTVARAFIIFIAVIVLAALFLIAGSLFAVSKDDVNEQVNPGNNNSKRDNPVSQKSPNVAIPHTKS